MVHPQMPQRPIKLLSTVENSLAPETFTLLKAIAEKASAMELSLYLVGGSVRDMLLGIPVKDLDVVVEGNAATLASEVARELNGDLLSYSRFGTATVKLEGQRFDLVTARREVYLRPGALPRVTPSTIQDDLERRDFSVNAMAVALSGPGAGRLLDPLGGKEDLKRGLIRVLHPGSFIDDATRILRAIRYEQRLRFHLEADAQRVLSEATEGGMLGTVSGDRLRRELGLMFNEEHPYLSLSRCGELGVLRAIYPPLEDGPGIKVLGDCTGEMASMMYLGALSYPLTVEEGESFINRLSMSSRWANVVRDTIGVKLRSGYTHPYIGQLDLTPGQLCLLLDQFSPIGIRVNALLSEHQRVREALQLYLNTLRHMKPSLNGRDLISLGVAQGPLVGEILGELRQGRIDGNITSREEEIQRVTQFLETKSD